MSGSDEIFNSRHIAFLKADSEPDPISSLPSEYWPPFKLAPRICARCSNINLINERLTSFTCRFCRTRLNVKG